MKKYLLSLIISTTALGQSNEFPVPDKVDNRFVPKSDAIEVDSEYKKLYESQMQKQLEESKEVEELRKKVQELEQGRVSPPTAEAASSGVDYSIPVKSPKEIGSEADYSDLLEGTPPQKKRVTTSKSNTTFSTSSGVKVFAVTDDDSEPSTVLPAGSWVRAKLMTGVKANSKYATEILLQLDYAYTGPNKTKIPLTGCLMIGGATADLSTERVVISPNTLSCVRENGEAVDRKISGFVAGKDSAIGLEGIVDSKQGRVFSAALLAGIAKGGSEAYQIANTVTDTVPGAFGTESKVTNFKGNFKDLAIARGVGNAAEMVTQWYLDQAKALLPTINTGSGQDVWVIMSRSVNIPSLQVQ